jgi:hypothetical protein
MYEVDQISLADFVMATRAKADRRYLSCPYQSSQVIMADAQVLAGFRDA